MMMSDDIIHYLFSAVENWEMMKDKASPLNLPVRPHPYCTQNHYFMSFFAV